MMNRVVIVHCWNGYPGYCWYPQTKKELEAEGFQVAVPEMPQRDAPTMSLWVPKLAEVVGKPDEHLYLVGHSAGCITILRYLETLKDDEKVGGVVLVAGFTDDLGFKELGNFFQTPLEFKKIKLKANHFVAIHSDDDPYVPLGYGDIFKKELGAQLIIKNAMGHFSGPVDETQSIISLPEVAASILKISKSFHS